MRVKAYLKKIGLVMSVLAIAISGNLFFLAPKTVKAEPADNSWVNRAVIKYQGRYFVDSNTFDPAVNFVSIDKSDDGRCENHDGLFFGLYAGIGSSPALGAFYYDAELNVNASIANFISFRFDAATGSCFQFQEPATLGSPLNRRLTYVFNATNAGDSNKISSIFNFGSLGGGPTFTKDTSRPITAHFPLYLYDGEAGTDICRDAIIAVPNDPRNDGSSGWFGASERPEKSAMLFAADQINNDRTAESLDIILNHPAGSTPGLCKVREERIEAGDPNGIYKIIDGNDGSVMIGAGIDNVNATDIATSGAYSDDSFILFIGNVGENTIPDSALEDAGGDALCPTDPTMLATDAACGEAAAGSEPCRIIDGGNSLANGLSWIICPLTAFIADSTSYIEQNFIGPLLTVNPLTINSPIYPIWDSFRNIANVVFAIVFMVIVLSTATGFGLSNLSIKKTLPAFFVGVIAANISFFLIAFAVDFFNIVQQGIANLASSIIVQPAVVTDAYASASVPSGWWIVGGVALAALVTGGAILGPVFGLILAIILIVLTAVLSLIFRQLVILALTAAAPIAIALKALPNMNKLFSFWWSNLIKMLLLGPVIALLFMAGKVLGAIMGSFDPTPSSPLDDKDKVLVLIMILLGYCLPLVGIPIVMAQGGSLMAGVSGLLNRARAGVQGVGRNAVNLGRQRYQEAIANRASIGAGAQTRTGRAIGRVLTGTMRPGGRRAQEAIAQRRAQRLDPLDEIRTRALYRAEGGAAVSAAQTLGARGVSRMAPQDVLRLTPDMITELLANADTQAQMRILIGAARQDPIVRGRITADQIARITAGGAAYPHFDPVTGASAPRVGW